MLRISLVLLLVACGARSEIGASEPEPVDASVVDVARDAPVEDVIVTDASCTSDSQCDDGIACTVDSCDEGKKSCHHVASYPQGTESSGDLAWVGSRLVASALTNGNDELVEFDVANKSSKVVGSTGFTCIWGLAAFGTTLYGLTCQGLVLSIDTTSGQATQLNASTATFWGASAR